MKKIMFTVLAMALVVLSYPQKWEKVNFPQDTTLKCAIYKGDTAIVFGGGQVFWADIKDCNWQSQAMPVTTDVKKCLNFKGKFYAIAGHNLLVSPDGLNWQIKLAEEYNLFWIFTNDKTLYIFSEGRVFMETSDGENFFSLDALYDFLNSHRNYQRYGGKVIATCLGDTILAVAIDDGFNASRALISADRGASWAWFSDLDVSGMIPADFISRYNDLGRFNFDLVGADRGMGTVFYHIYNEGYNFDEIAQFIGYPGQLLTLCYWRAEGVYQSDRWAGGYISDNSIGPVPHQGFIIAKNDLSTIQFFDYPVRCLAVGKRSAMAVGDHGQIYATIRYGLDIETIGAMGGEIQVFPNPTDGFVTVRSKNKQTAGIYDLLGRQIQEIQLPTGEIRIDLSGCQTGIYLLRGENWSKKILKR